MAAWAPFQGVLWLVWDGASFEVVRELIEAGELPALQRLSEGNVHPLPPLDPNCQTPPSLASKFTGTASAAHGVTGFRVPALDPPGTLAESRSGFDRSLLRRAPVWEDLAESGRWAGTSHIPWTRAGRVPEGDAGTAVDAYERCLAGPDVVPLDGRRSVDLGGHELRVEPCPHDWELCAPATGDRVPLMVSGPLRLHPDPLRFGPGLATRVGTLTVSGHSLLVHTGLWEQRISPRHRQPALDEHVGAFTGKLLGQAYGAGTLGPRACEGGDGTAEEALLETARLQATCFRRSCEVVLAGAPGGLVVGYLPTIDEVQHETFRWWVDAVPDRPGRLLRDTVRRAYRLADEQLGQVLGGLGPEAAVVVSSDHGAAALRRYHHVNETLARAGLAAFDGRGVVDPRATRAAYHPAANGSVWVNGTELPGGIVGPDTRDLVVAETERVLQAFRDPATGRPSFEVTRVSEPERSRLGDLFLRHRPGYECRAEAGPAGAEVVEVAKGGTHLTPTGETTLQGMLTVGGAIHGAAVRAGGMMLTDLLPLVEDLLAARRVSQATERR